MSLIDSNEKKENHIASTEAPERTVTVLAISGHEEDHVILRNIFSHSKWRLRDAKSWSDARRSLGVQPAAVIICDRTLPDAEWTDVLAYAQAAPAAPLLIVSARTADDRLWAEVLNLGAYDLLLKPFVHTEVVRVISLAWLNWKHQRDRFPKQTTPGGQALSAGA